MPTIAHELDRIGERVALLASAYRTLHDENRALRLAVDQRDSENRLLRDRLESACERVERLIARVVPES